MEIPTALFGVLLLQLKIKNLLIFFSTKCLLVYRRKDQALKISGLFYLFKLFKLHNISYL